MKQTIIAVLLAVASVMAQDKEPHRYLLVYSEYHMPSGGGIDPCFSYGSCWTETKVAWFSSPQEALDFLNKPQGVVISSGYGSAWNQPSKFDNSNVIGLYEVKSLDIRMEQVGTEKRLVSEQVERELPKIEWRLKP